MSTALLGASLVGFGACDSTQKSDTGDFRVALLTPGSIADQSWNGGAYAGLLRIRDSLGARISHIQTRTPAEFEENFRQYGSQGYDMVIGHGFEFQDAAMRVAPAYPRTVYVVTSGRRVGPNVAGMGFAFEEASYLAGMIAGALSKSGTIATIGGSEFPPVVRSFRAFESGAKRARADIKVLGAYIGNWDDISAGKEQAIAMIARGADIIFQNADAAGLGVFQAAREAKTVRVFGSNSDQNSVAPEVTIGSVVIDLPLALSSVAKEVKDGTFRGRVIELGIRSNVVRLVLNPVLMHEIPPAIRARVDSVEAGMRSGTITLTVTDTIAPDTSSP